MSFYSRPDHLRIPGPNEAGRAEKNSEKSPESVIEDSATENRTVEPSHENTSSTPPPATDAPIEPEATGSALEAWSGPETALTAPAAPRVRESGARPAQTPVTQTQPTPPAKKAAPPKRKPTAEQAKAQAEAVRQKHIEEHRETRILVIENDVEAADHVINILENDGYAVEIATDATYGAMLAQTFLPHLIVLGALSEQLTGADFMRSLRNTTGFAERSQVTPVLYLIDNSQLLQQRFQGLRDTPLTSTIFKPANERELLQKVERALSPDTDFPAETL